MRMIRSVQLAALVALSACSSLGVKDEAGQDPLRNTRKLAAEGHATLYNNGAFEVPMTTIHIIPAGPSAWELAEEMAGLRAQQSFEESVKHARESMGLAQAGVSKSMAAAAAVNEGTNAAARGVRTAVPFGAKIARAAPDVGAGIIGASVTYAGHAYTSVHDAGKKMADDSVRAGGELSARTDDVSGGLLAGGAALASRTSQGSYETAKRHASYAFERFVKGYAAVPEKFGQHVDAVARSASFEHFVEAVERSWQWRAEKSGTFTDILVNTTDNYAGDVKKSFGAAKREITEGSKESGPTLAMLKSLRWVVQGIFWDASIKPAGKLAGASLGYITVNAVAFPTLVTVREGVAVANVAVQVTWNSAASVYDVTAPTVTSAVAGLFSAVELVGGQVVAGGELAGGAAAAAGTYGAGKLAAGATAGGGWLGGKTVQYVGAPLSWGVPAVGGTAAGVVAGTFTAVGGGGMMAAGAVGEGATQVVGKTAAGVVGAGGSAVSVAAGTALGTYELAKAVVVPAGYELGAGMVVGYGTLSQLGAQSVLAVSDASYMVLSLEGPRWVLYAVKGNVDKGESLPPGTLLDLEAMQKAGETFYAVPVSNEEMERVVKAAPADLPVKPATTDTTAP